MSKWLTLGIAMVILLGSVLAIVAYHLIVILPRERSFAALQRKVSSWGGRIDFVNETDPLKAGTIRRWLGRDLSRRYLGSPGVYVSAKPNAVKPSMAELLGGPPIRRGDFYGCQNLDDDWIAGIRFPASVVELGLAGTAVSDRSVPAFERMTSLRVLDLADSQITDLGVARLWKLPALGALIVGGPKLQLAKILEAEVLDEAGQPTVSFGSRYEIRGRLAIDAQFQRPTLVLNKAPLPGSTLGRHSTKTTVEFLPACELIREPSGTYRFSCKGDPYPGDMACVELWLRESIDGGPTIHYRIAMFAFESTTPPRLSPRTPFDKAPASR